jgi:5'-3' exonuclease
MDNLLIDGKNSLYRSVFAGFVDPRFKQLGHDYFLIFLRFINNYINKFRPKSVHIFWDAKRSWRKTIYHEYKAQRKDQYIDRGFDVPAELRRQMIIAIETLRYLNVRQYFNHNQEADDLIYAFIKNNINAESIILSGDGDFKQITFRHSHIKIYNPLSKKLGFEDTPSLDPILVKALTGDKSDNIGGYYGVGKVKVKPLILDEKIRAEFFASDKAFIMQDGQKQLVGDTIFERNKQIIDLGMNPHLQENVDYITSQQLVPISFNIGIVKSVIFKYKLRGLMADIDNLSLPFKNLQ